eukprot:gene19640-biopygen35721
MEDWQVTSTKGRRVYWRSGQGNQRVLWTKYVKQPTLDTVSDDDTSEEAMESDRVVMVKALALPYVTFNQEVYEAATSTAKKKLERAYNACARVAAGTERTEEALEKLGWPTYDAQQLQSQTKLATKIANQREPRCLFLMLNKTPPPLEDTMITARRRAQVWECPEYSHRLTNEARAAKEENVM